MTIEKKGMPEGLYLNKYILGRLKKNKNFIIAITGSTGSGKTYSALKISENWYEYYFKSGFPIENICFSLEEVAKRLKDRNLRRGELLILEEAGANLGALEFQSKMSRVFTYILQSFRSMNVGLILTLPVLTMLNKQARQLLHAHMTTEGIIEKKCKLKIKIHQLNQHTGKSYWKAPIIKYCGMKRKMPYVMYSLASEDLRSKYEEKKENFVYRLVDGFEDDIKTKEQKKLDEKARVQEQTREINIKREKYLAKHRRNKKNKIVCEECGRANIIVGLIDIRCRVCGHIELIK